MSSRKIPAARPLTAPLEIQGLTCAKPLPGLERSRCWEAEEAHPISIDSAPHGQYPSFIEVIPNLVVTALVSRENR